MAFTDEAFVAVNFFAVVVVEVRIDLADFCFVETTTRYETLQHLYAFGFIRVFVSMFIVALMNCAP